VQPGWAPRVNLRTLDLRTPRACVLGQVFRARWWPLQSGYARAFSQVPALHPFILNTGVFAQTCYEPLWREAIRARVPAPVPLARRLLRFWRTRAIAALLLGRPAAA
jgi:hypothetical protein